MSAPIRVAIADDHPLILNALEQLFRAEPDIHVVGRCTRGDEVTRMVRRQHPDILILDHVMAGATGIEVLRALQHEPNAPRTIVLSALIRDEEVVEAIRLGAKGVLMKDTAPRQIVACVRDVHKGGEWLGHHAGARAVKTLLRRETATREVERLLTPRELELVRYVAAGLRNKDIGERLKITEGTVKIHLHNIFDKVGVRGRVALVVWAKDKGVA